MSDVDPIEGLGQEEEAEDRAAEAETADAEPEPEGLEGDGEEDDGAEEPRLYAGKFRSAEEMERSYSELQRQMGQMGNELGQLRQQLTPQQPQRQQQQEEPQLTREQWEEWALEDAWSANQWLAAQTALQVQAMQQQQLQPVLQSVNRSEAAATIQRLREEFGDDVVMENRETLARMIQGDESYFMDPDQRYQRLSVALKAAQYDRVRQRDTRRPRRADGRYARAPHTEGGSTPQPPDAQPDEDPILREMAESAPAGDRFGRGPGGF